MGNELVAPFPWFGGKSKAAPLVWAALGDVDNYVEPFAGSKERLWLSPHCLDSTPSLLEQSAGDDDEEGEGEHESRLYLHSPVALPGRLVGTAQRGPGSYGLLPVGMPERERGLLLYSDCPDVRPFPTEEAAWDYARQLAVIAAKRRGGQPVEGSYRGTFGVWRAWVVRYD